MIVSLRLADKPVLVVGSGREAVYRSEMLSLNGAKVRLVSTAKRSPELQLCGANFSFQKRLRTRDLKGVFLVIATDRDSATNEWLAKKSRKFGFLLNTLDERQTSTFYNVAVRRVSPDVQIAVSTDGSSPAFASRLSTRLANQVDQRDLEVLQAFKSNRDRLKAIGQSTFDFDWNELEYQVRRGNHHIGEVVDSFQNKNQASSGMAAALVQSDEDIWPITPFTNNLLRNRSSKNSS
ncbi:MAG: hypothetical protein HKL84_04140 [Acidimicrobiaceae bacterium]|nr:hypothetical protein [Acidimicrobiaceae bacterium]